MELKAKFGFTVIFILGFFILKGLSKLNNNRLKKRLEGINPQLVEKAPGFFSKDKQNFLDWLFGIMIFIFLILMWTNVIVIPLK